MKNVMTRAWEIAREGVKKFGGKVKEYFAQALVMAWEEVKGMASRVKGTIQPIELPALEGSEKQVKWAENIRANALKAMQIELVREDWKEGQPKRSVKGLLQPLTSKKATQEYLDQKPEFLVEGTIKSMNNLLDRFDRYTEIATQSSAKFWIDNRDNQEKNYMFNLFEKYVATGVKEF